MFSRRDLVLATALNVSNKDKSWADWYFDLIEAVFFSKRTCLILTFTTGDPSINKVTSGTFSIAVKS